MILMQLEETLRT